MTYQPPRAIGMLIGSTLTLWSAAIAILLMNHAIAVNFGFSVVITLTCSIAAATIAALFGYWTYALGTLSYEIDRNGLVIYWGATRQVIPLEAIERIVPGTSVGIAPVRGVSWLGYHVGLASIERVGDVLFYSTHQDENQVLYVMTSGENYAISVDNPAEFAREVQIRQGLGPTATVAAHAQRMGSATQAFWYDPVSHVLVGTALLASFLMWTFVSFRYPALPIVFEMHFPAHEESRLVDVRTKEAILQLPQIATILLVINLLVGFVLHTRGRIASYLLFVVATIVQLLFTGAIAIAIKGV